MGNYLICYDISDDKRRNSVASLLKHCGVRQQKSVFVVSLAVTGMRRLQHTLTPLLNEGDSIVVFPLCRDCLDKALFCGARENPAVVC